MSKESLGPSSSIQLVQNTNKAKNVKLCIICQHAKDVNGDIKLTSTPEGREKVIKTSHLLADDILYGLNDSELSQIQYHVRWCYARYKRTGERHVQNQDVSKRQNTETKTSIEITSPVNRLKRRKTIDNLKPRIDIIFDLYNDNSIKGSERSRRGTASGIHTPVKRPYQPLPIEMDRFWSLATNKVSFQQFFIQWITRNYSGDKILYLGGCHVEDHSLCVKVSSQSAVIEPMLKCTHEEAGFCFT